MYGCEHSCLTTLKGGRLAEESRGRKEVDSEANERLTEVGPLRKAVNIDRQLCETTSSSTRRDYVE